MQLDPQYLNPEPVAPASQLAILPFLATAVGFLKLSTPRQIRLTVHRTMVREKRGYLQQAAPYVGIEDTRWKEKVGRIFPVNFGIMGKAFGDRKIMRTKHFSDEKTLLTKLKEDMEATKDKGDINKLARSWLAIPILGAQEQPILIFYGESWDFDFFASDERLKQLTAMCGGFAQLLDWLQEDPFPNLRNFPVLPGEPVKEEATVYPQLQEKVDWLAPPKCERVTSFNYEASAG